MRFDQITLQNWRNFRSASLKLPDRAFIIGPNASGKSNFLDVFRFLGAVAQHGLQQACQERGGLSKIRSLFARSAPNVKITVTMTDGSDRWSYELVFNQETQFPNQGQLLVQSEIVKKNDETILSRPNDDDQADAARRTQTALEQVAANRDFRVLNTFFASTIYLHVVPQMIRNASGFMRETRFPTIYGGELLEDIARTTEKIRTSRLKKIEAALKLAVPQLSQLTLQRDERGSPHLSVIYEHWRPKAGKQDENQLSDGTLRLIGLLWALQAGNGLALLEEPELSLHPGVVRHLAPFIHRTQQRKDGGTRQVFVSTHSPDLLNDPGIGAEEIIVLVPTKDGTTAQLGMAVDDIRSLMASGLTAADAALPRTIPDDADQLPLFDL